MVVAVGARVSLAVSVDVASAGVVAADSVTTPVEPVVRLAVAGVPTDEISVGIVAESEFEPLSGCDESRQSPSVQGSSVAVRLSS